MKIADKDTKAVDLVRAALEKAKEYEDYHAFISMNEAHALERAREIDAKIEYKVRFPRSFVKAFDQVMKANGYTRERTADELGIHVNTLSNRLNGKSQMRAMKNITST